MILYKSDYFGVFTLLNLNGSAAYRAFLPALFSTAMIFIYKYTWGDKRLAENIELTVHPYVITIYITAFSLMLNFRLNYSYQRYWEAATQIFIMTSKWMDSAICLGSFHYQSSAYDAEGNDVSNGDSGKEQVNKNDNIRWQKRPPTFGGGEADQEMIQIEPQLSSNDSEYDEENETYITSETGKKKSSSTTISGGSQRQRRKFSDDQLPPFMAELSLNGSSKENNNNNNDTLKTSNAGKRRASDSRVGVLNKLFFWNGPEGNNNDNNDTEITHKTNTDGVTSTSDTTATSATIPNQNIRKSHHRRIPSVDIPRPGTTIIKSFNPNPEYAYWDPLKSVTSTTSHITSQNKRYPSMSATAAYKTKTGLHSSIVESDLGFESLLLSTGSTLGQKRKHHSHRRSHHRSSSNDKHPKRRASMPVPTHKSTINKKKRHRPTKLETIDSDRQVNSERIASENDIDNINSIKRSPIRKRVTMFLPTFKHSNRSNRNKKSDIDAIIEDDSTSDNDPSSSIFRENTMSMDEFYDEDNDDVDQHSNSGSDDSHSKTGSASTGGSTINNDFALQDIPLPVPTFLPSLFLQEAAHLYSLMSAVAMASLRADLEGCASPLIEYVPGQPFPPVNPDEMRIKVWLNTDEEDDNKSNDSDDSETAKERSENEKRALNEKVDDDEIWYEKSKLPNTNLPSKWNHKYWARNSRVLNSIYFLFGISRTPRQRTLYNASRPFSVLGGLSDNEMEILQKARGPEAQMALCSLWLKEFISREHLNGSTGTIAPPIVSRVYQFLSDGNAQYNQCRKISYTVFPFPHQQLTSFFLLVSVFIFPYLYYTYVNSLTLACLLNFASMACFEGMHEVAREMQDPFYQFPNDLPLNNYQAQFNEALISSLYGGFHPDAPDETKEIIEEE